MLLWTLFIGTVLLFLALDLGVFHKNAEIISNKNAAKWTLIWAVVSLCFSGIIYLVYQANAVNNPENYSPLEATLKYITGYVVELSLSADNIFVIAVIFSSFKIAQKHQHRILFWGILGAIAFRGILIFLAPFWSISLIGSAMYLVASWFLLPLKCCSKTMKNPLTPSILRHIN